MRLDHIVFAAGPGGLAGTAARLSELLGEEFQDGGVHPRFGTRIRIDLVRFAHQGVGPELAKVPDEGVDETVVIVDDQHACRGHWTVDSCGSTIEEIHGKTYQKSP